MSSLAQEIRAIAEKLDELNAADAASQIAAEPGPGSDVGQAVGQSMDPDKLKGGAIDPSAYSKVGMSSGMTVDLSFLSPGLRGVVEKVTPYGAIVQVQGKDAPPLVFGQDALAWFQSRRKAS